MIVGNFNIPFSLLKTISTHKSVHVTQTHGQKPHGHLNRDRGFDKIQHPFVIKIPYGSRNRRNIPLNRLIGKRRVGNRGGMEIRW